jgi:hypothetical protein
MCVLWYLVPSEEDEVMYVCVVISCTKSRRWSHVCVCCDILYQVKKMKSCMCVLWYLVPSEEDEVMYVCIVISCTKWRRWSHVCVYCDILYQVPHLLHVVQASTIHTYMTSSSSLGTRYHNTHIHDFIFFTWYKLSQHTHTWLHLLHLVQATTTHTYMTSSSSLGTMFFNSSNGAVFVIVSFY